MSKSTSICENISDEENLKKITYMCEKAIKRAKDFGYEFNYESKDINGLEEILEDLFLAKKTENLDNDFLWRWAYIFGNYLGETIVRNSGNNYRWAIINKSKYQELNSDVPVLVANNNWICTPIDKVYKRLLNGKVDNIEMFYKDVLSIIK